MSFSASLRYYLYRSPWVMLFTVSGIAFGFVIAMAFDSAVSETVVTYALLTVIIFMGLGAAGMGLEVAAEMDD